MKNGGSAKGLMAVVMCGTMIWTACSTAWIGEAEQIVAALIPATTNLLALVGELRGKGISSADLGTIQSSGAQVEASLQFLESLMAAYQRADAGARPGQLNQIQAATNALQSTLSSLLQALHSEDEVTQAKITAVAGLVLSEVESLAAILPMANANASPRMMATAAKQVKKQPPLTAGEFVASYNATLTAKTGNAALDHSTASMQIHMHGKFARWASVGILK